MYFKKEFRNSALCIFLSSLQMCVIVGQLVLPQDNTYIDPNRAQFNLDPRLQNERLSQDLLQSYLKSQDRKLFEPSQYSPPTGGGGGGGGIPPQTPISGILQNPSSSVLQNPSNGILQNPANPTRAAYPQINYKNNQQIGQPLQEQAYLVHDQDIRNILGQIDAISSEQCRHNVLAQWAYETNVNDVTQYQALQSQAAYAELQSKIQQFVRTIPEESVQDPRLRRQLKLLNYIGAAALPLDQRERYNRLINEMLAVHNSATICAYNEPLRCDLKLEPEITYIMAHSRDWDQLQHTWIEWHRRSGQKLRDLYEQLVEISNYAATLNGQNLTDYAQYWMEIYETPGFRFELEDVWQEIKPLYEQLHAYVRRKLRDLYGPEKISREAPLPAHILGNMWAQSWSNILDITIPYPGKNYPDVTPQMLQQGYTPEALFRLAEEFYVSLNLSAMPPEFWARSVLEEPLTPTICQPSAWDFCDGRDYRIKMCSEVNAKDFITAHHEMAHLEYFISYRNQPKIFRDGANPALHEAVSEAISLSVRSPKHLQHLGLLYNAVDDIPHNINYLFGLALEKLPFLPFSMALDFWRWDIFQGTVPRDRYNCHWWDLREKFGGVKPPVLRTETDFDPGAKYHVAANIPYIRYFVGTVLQFQLHRSMCIEAKRWGQDTSKPLHKCDIYRSKEAGNILKILMEKGASEPWSDVLFAATRESKLDGRAMRDFFRPLEDWLRSENIRTGEYVGWNYDGDYCKYSIETANLQVYGGFYGKASTLNSSSFPIILTLIFIITIIL
ncbi:angiotensin-converting enzyme-like isoform X2 [Lycorma delicatula]|uniref:angiotensin-converting enzyme-like isoform X2 n=1 Tax=Lycorma delicatula TaxID=130591 RepID=UPI003F517E66